MGQDAPESTGFATTFMDADCTEKHDPGRRNWWLKAHLGVGTATHIILGVRIAPEHGAVCLQFNPFLRSIVEAGFRPAGVVADKALLARE